MTIKVILRLALEALIRSGQGVAVCPQHASIPHLKNSQTIGPAVCSMLLENLYLLQKPVPMLSDHLEVLHVRHPDGVPPCIGRAVPSNAIAPCGHPLVRDSRVYLGRVGVRYTQYFEVRGSVWGPDPLPFEVRGHTIGDSAPVLRQTMLEF